MSARSNEYVAISDEGEISIHLPGVISDYGTLCGLDGRIYNGMHADEMKVIEVPRGAKVDCAQCKKIWQQAKHFRASDFV